MRKKGFEVFAAFGMIIAPLFASALIIGLILYLWISDFNMTTDQFRIIGTTIITLCAINILTFTIFSVVGAISSFMRWANRKKGGEKDAEGH